MNYEIDNERFGIKHKKVTTFKHCDFFIFLKVNLIYQLAFVTPGINPLLAISRKVTREIPN